MNEEKGKVEGDADRRRARPLDPKFTLGQLVVTQRAEEAVSQEEGFLALARYLEGDWGEVEDKDRELNERAVRDGGRLFSVYSTGKGIRFWVVTNAPHTVTMVLLPEEY
jgi:hypothetical protein